MEKPKKNFNKKSKRVTSGDGPLEKPICEEKQSDIITDDEEDLDTPLWAKRQFSSLRNFIDAIYTRWQNRYDAFEARLVSLEENMSAASADTLAAKKVADNSAVLIAQYSNKLLSLQDEQKHFTIYTAEAKHQMNNFRQQNEHLKELILKQDTYSRRSNLIIRGP